MRHLYIKNIPFIIVLALTLSGEGMLTVTLTWTILDRGGSVTQLGIILALMSILPFILQKYFLKLRKLIENSPLLIFSACRGIGIIVALYSLFNAKHIGVNSLYVFAGIFSVILFLSTQSLETFMSQLVLKGKITSKKASNLLQTSIQFGAFGGNAIAGFLLNMGGFTYILCALIFSLGIGIFVSFFTKRLENNQNANVEKQQLHIERTPITNLKSNTLVLTLTIVAIGILTVQLASFNFLIPIIYHDVHKWDPSEYGMVSSAAGVGALLATLIGKYEKYIPTYIFLLLALIDLSLGFVDSWFISILCALCLGFVFNRSRIFQRQLMFDHIFIKEETVVWTGRSTLVLQITKAATPLILAIPLEWIGNNHSGALFGIMGISVVLLLTVVYYSESKNVEKVKLDIESLKTTV